MALFKPFIKPQYLPGSERGRNATIGVPTSVKYPPWWLKLYEKKCNKGLLCQGPLQGRNPPLPPKFGTYRRIYILPTQSTGGEISMVLVKSQVKEATDLNVASDVYDALEDKVREIIKAAEKRAKENGRKTIKAYDL